MLFKKLVVGGAWVIKSLSFKKALHLRPQYLDLDFQQVSLIFYFVFHIYSCTSFIYSCTLFIYLFIFGCLESLLLSVGFSLVVARGRYSLLRCTGFSLQWLLLLWGTGSRRVGFSSCGTRAE